MLSRRILILSKNDKWHKLENLGSRIVRWAKDLPGVETDTSHDLGILASGQLDAYDVCVLCATMSELTAEGEQALVGFVEKGGVLFGIHSATVVDEKSSRYVNLIGGGFSHHSSHHEFQVQIADAQHPITSAVGDFVISDELYVLDREPERAHILATALWEDRPQPLVYVKGYGRGQVLYNALGHDEAAFDNLAFQKLVIQGIKWAYELVT